jgi:hypothetical protein
MMNRKMKKGSVDWTVGKLMAIVLAVVLLVIVVFGWSSGVSSLVDRAGGMVDEVLILLRIKDRGGEVDCFERDVVIDGVGEGRATYCKGYCEVEIEAEIEGLDFKSSFFRFDGSSGWMGYKIEKDGEWDWSPQAYYNLDVEKVDIARGLYGVYKEAHEEYFNNHKKSRLDMGLDVRSEVRVYVRIGSKLYRWMEDVRTWEVCRREVNAVYIEEYCGWSEKGRWDVRVGDEWESVEDLGQGFDYFGKLVENWVVGDVFWYSVDFVNLIDEESPTLDLMQGVREKEIEDYKDGLRMEFERLLREHYALQDSQFLIYVNDVTSINSPGVSFDSGDGVVTIRRAGYLDDIVVDVVAPGEGEVFFDIVEGRMTDEVWMNVAKISKIYKFLEGKGC